MRKRLGFGLAVVLVVSATASAAQAIPIGRPDPDGPDGPPVLAEKGHGAETADRLGPNADAVAARLHLSAKELRQRMKDDNSLWLDRTGHAFYVEPVAPAPIAQTAGSPQAAAPFPYSQTFTLHSRPGSNRVLYLDFDGQTVSGTGWNAAGLVQTAVPPFDADGNPVAFSLAEQDLIQGVWQRVSDDYAPFDVDVTTQDPGIAALTQTNAADLTFGMRAVITSSPTVMTQTCGSPCGGIAFVGGFGTAFYSPAFIFADALSNNEKWIAEATSHELGHTLGLSHDGTVAFGSTPAAGYYSGHGSWAPSMGSGYNKPVVQFSKGEYAFANNTEDDLAIIASSGVVAIGDDFGKTIATVLPSGSPPTTAGLISARGDIDMFRVNTPCAGPLIASAAPIGISPNLDIRLRILDATGTQLVSDDRPLQPYRVMWPAALPHRHRSRPELAASTSRWMVSVSATRSPLATPTTTVSVAISLPLPPVPCRLERRGSTMW